MRLPRGPARALLAVALLSLAAGTASAKGGAHTGPKSKPAASKAPEWSEEAGTFTLQVFDPPLKAYVQAIVRNTLQYQRLYDDHGQFRPIVGTHPVHPSTETTQAGAPAVQSADETVIQRRFTGSERGE